MDVNLRKRIVDRLMELEENPFPRGSIKLRGERDSHRLRIGDNRILYKIHRDEDVILIFKIEHRKKVYRE